MIFISKGDEPLTVRQATKRGVSYVAQELAQAGARKGDEELLRVIPHADLPQRLQDIVAALGHASYGDYAAAWEADNAINGVNNIFNHQLAGYRKALARLARYRLADGRPEVTEEIATGAIDPNTGAPISETVIVQPAIDPLPAQVEQPVHDPDTGEQTGTEMVPNPAIVQDDADRATAQAVIDGLPQAVREFTA